MKSINRNIYLLNLLLLHSLILKNTQASTMSSNDNQPIYINAKKQTISINTNIITFIGDVVIRRGSIDIRADKVIITRPDGKNGHEIVEGYGNPVTFYQLQDDGQPIRGHALKVRYEIANDCIILTGDPYLEKRNSYIKGNCITYLLKQQYLEALSSQEKKVTVMLGSIQQLQGDRN